MSPGTISPLASIKALTFDVFGTTVDWRSSVIAELELRIHRKLNAAADGTASLSAPLRARLQQLRAEDSCSPAGTEAWTGRFAAAWRRSYIAFVQAQGAAGGAGRHSDGNQGSSSGGGGGGGDGTFKTADEHLHDSLVSLLREWQLADLFTPAELSSLSMVWHRLTPWPDSAPGLARLAAPPLGLATATLSNGNAAILRDLDDYGALGFAHLLCAETFRAYKPSPEAYRAAARALGLETPEVAMVAAHLLDLAAAREVGMRTVYVERAREEEGWPGDDERFRRAREWVDVWIEEGEEGFVELARRLEELRA